ncbi:hypothetical protein VKT23_004453 [Stygiomarasmius scandens]|uniref:F-box domain-containing protein n=1 Tax=Marasmiellus scandens TaxID=2682957 RepID=A0ABR1JU62_9AGAR
MTDIGSLYIPTELLERIIHEIDVKEDRWFWNFHTKKDLKTLRCVNSTFCSLVDPILFSKIKIDLSIHSPSDAMDKLRVLASKSSRISPHVRALVISSVILKYPFEGWLKAIASVNKYFKEQKEAWAYLLKALRSWRNLLVVDLLWEDAFPEFWLLLQEEKIHLRQVKIFIVSDDLDRSFSEYLSSYSGLESLDIHFQYPSNPAASTAEDFCSKVLPKHYDSLRLLGLCSYEQGSGWSFGKRSIEWFSRCVELRTLRVSIDADDIREVNSEEDIVNLCLNFAQNFPHLSMLAMSPAYIRRPPRQSFLRFGNTNRPRRCNFALHEEERNRIVDRVLAYKPSLESVGNFAFEVMVDHDSLKRDVDGGFYESPVLLPFFRPG